VSEVGVLLDHLFRRESARMVATLASIFGSRNIEMAEEVVQEALVRALQLWPFQGVPENPRAWLIQVARRLAVDRFRRETTLAAKVSEIERRMEPSQPDPEPVEEQLAMMFLCCHPELPRASRVALTLKVAAGFSVAEIARAFLTSEETIAQRIVRAKRQIREQNLAIEMPEKREMADRLDSVLEALYPQDPWMGLLKPFFLGFAIVSISCHVGLRTRGGTQGVGRAVTTAVVASSVAVLAVDFFITRLLITLMY